MLFYINKNDKRSDSRVELGSMDVNYEFLLNNLFFNLIQHSHCIKEMKWKNHIGTSQSVSYPANQPAIPAVSHICSLIDSSFIVYVTIITCMYAGKSKHIVHLEKLNRNNIMLW